MFVAEEVHGRDQAYKHDVSLSNNKPAANANRCRSAAETYDEVTRYEE